MKVLVQQENALAKASEENTCHVIESEEKSFLTPEAYRLTPKMREAVLKNWV